MKDCPSFRSVSARILSRLHLHRDEITVMNDSRAGDLEEKRRDYRGGERCRFAIGGFLSADKTGFDPAAPSA